MTVKRVYQASGVVVVVVGSRPVARRTATDALSLADLYEELSTRMALALEALDREEHPPLHDDHHTWDAFKYGLDAAMDRHSLFPRLPVQDENKFHEPAGSHKGGQFTTGPKPTTAAGKSAKAKFHALLSSGHAFTKAELMEIAGIKTNSLFSAYMSMIVDPKYVTKKGTLDIKKLPNGTYQVVTPDGVQAPALENALPKFDLAEWNYQQELLAAIKADNAANKAAEKFDPLELGTPEEIAAAELELEEGQQQVLPVIPTGVVAPKEPTPFKPLGLKAVTPPDTPMTKNQADKIYADTKQVLINTLAMQAKGALTTEMLLEFKQGKAIAMAQWAANTSGNPVKPKPQQVYNEDVALGGALKIAHTKEDIDQVVQHWMQNTANAKNAIANGKLPPAFATPMKASESVGYHPEPKPSLDEYTDVTPIAYNTLVPKTHQHVNEDDFKLGGKTHKIRTDFESGMEAAQKVLKAHAAGGATENKKAVEARLRERLKDAPNFKKLIAHWAGDKTGIGSIESRLIQTWASSSGDNNPLSVSMQLAVRDAFSIPHEHVEMAQIGHSVKALGENQVHVQGAAQMGFNLGTPGKIKTWVGALKEFAHAQYHETQEMFKAAGVKHVYLVRGMKNERPASGKRVALKLQPASSFSTSYGTAHGFTGGAGTVFLSKVPVEQCLGSFATGFGCTFEQEVVVLAHENLRAFEVPRKSGFEMNQASLHLSELHKKAKEEAAA